MPFCLRYVAAPSGHSLEARRKSRGYRALGAPAFSSQPRARHIMVAIWSTDHHRGRGGVRRDAGDQSGLFGSGDPVRCVAQRLRVDGHILEAA